MFDQESEATVRTNLTAKLGVEYPELKAKLDQAVSALGELKQDLFSVLETGQRKLEKDLLRQRAAALDAREFSIAKEADVDEALALISEAIRRAYGITEEQWDREKWDLQIQAAKGMSEYLCGIGY